MEKNLFAPLRTWLAAGLLALAGITEASAQEPAGPDSTALQPADSLAMPTEMRMPATGSGNLTVRAETALPERNDDRPAPQWRPDPKRALWLALVFPGGGQIYNRKYWKLPLVYGGFMGCLYAMNWNNTMYKDYSQAYLDLMDSDPATESYNQFLHLGMKITPENAERYKTIFKKRKDKFRRWRDLSFFVMVGVYALSVVDAYVDAELSVFDISKDLSLKVEPTILNDRPSSSLLSASSLGLQCSLNF